MNSSACRILLRRSRIASLGHGCPLALAFIVLLFSSGCVVGQPRGAGKLARIVEPAYNASYWLYLPKSYVESDEAQLSSRRWPLVVTFHGMKPFDNALPQALEWEQEADRYGYIVVAPQLAAMDVLKEFPKRTVHPSFQADERNALAVLDHVFATTRADPTNVLSTSWSSGGYMAHYMLNRHPNRFSCLAVRQSNFSSEIMESSITPRSLDHPILIVNTENDFAICKAESREAVRWYDAHGYRNVGWVYLKSLGHERTPDIAAEFFGRASGVEPIQAPAVLVQRQAIDGNATGLAFLSGKTRPGGARPRGPGGAPPRPVLAARPTTPPRATVSSPRPAPPQQSPPPVVTATPPKAIQRPSGPAVSSIPPTVPPGNRATPTREMLISEAAPPTLNIRVSSAIGIEPLHLGFWADCPRDWQQNADFLWTLNGQSIANGVNGQKTIAEVGEHTLGLLVVTRDGDEHRITRRIRVLPRVETASTASLQAAGK